jgi:hypothetical protein
MMASQAELNSIPPPPHRFNSSFDSNGTERDWLTLEIGALETGLAYAKKNNIRYVSFFEGESLHELDLCILRELPNLHGLEIVCKLRNRSNADPVYALQDLRQLLIRTDFSSLDLSHFPSLETLSFGRLHLSGGANAISLVDVLVYNYTNAHSKELASIPHLRNLELKGCKDQTVDHFSEYPSVHRLVLSYPQNLASIDEIARSKVLRELSVDHASKVQDYSPLGLNASIDSIYLRLKQVNSCSFVRTMPNLKWLKIVARILDNDIQPILDSDSLLDAELMPMGRSYSPRMTQSELSEYLHRKNGE